MTLPPELASVKEAGEILSRAGHPAGQRILDWFSANCPSGERDFFDVYATGRTWETEIKRVRRDDLLRQAAALLDHGDVNERARLLCRWFRRYREEVWPNVRAGEECPADHDEFDRLFWNALRLNPHDVRTDQFRQILSE